MTSVRANVAVLTLAMTSVGDPAARECVVQLSPKLLSAHDDAWGVGLCRFFSDDVDRSKSILMMATVR